jgi:hypothetical protein
MIVEIDREMGDIGDRIQMEGGTSIRGEVGVDQETPEIFVNVETLHIQILKDERISNSEDLAAVGAMIQEEIIMTEIIIIITTGNQ